MNTPSASPVDVAIVGAGAAGLMAAIAAGRAGASVRVLEGANRKTLGAKIKVSGGTRCNVTNADVVPGRYHGEGAPAFVGRILRAFSPDDTHRFFQQIGVELKLEATGKFFPVTDSSRTVLNALLTAVEAAGVVLSTETPVTAIERVEVGWCLQTPHEMVLARAVVLATGGLALPKTGSDGRGYALARRLGHKIIQTTPALTPFIAKSAPHAAFSGLTIPVRLKLFRGREATANTRLAAYEGSFLFTHFGYSGPVALNLSRHIARERLQNHDASVYASFLPQVADGAEGQWWQEWTRANAKRGVSSALGQLMPNRLADALATRSHTQSASVGTLNKHQIAALKRELFAVPLSVSEVAPYEKAETTAGGVALAEIEPATMMSRLASGLFFTGEVCDVDGWLGGYNFQWCWSSGTVAGRAAAKWARHTG